MSVGEVLTAILPMILILVLLYAALIFVRRSGFSMGKNQNKLSQIRVISTQALMHKKFISIVKVKDSYLVLGVAENSITLLKELDNIDEKDDELKNESKSKFSDVFKQNLGLKWRNIFS